MSVSEPDDATPFLPDRPTLSALREAVAAVTLARRHVVGPAGRELDRGLEEAGIDRREAYVTSARGEPVESDPAPLVTATIHPSAILRAPDYETRARECEAFARDVGPPRVPDSTRSSIGCFRGTAIGSSETRPRRARWNGYSDSSGCHRPTVRRT